MKSLLPEELKPISIGLIKQDNCFGNHDLGLTEHQKSLMLKKSWWLQKLTDNPMIPLHDGSVQVKSNDVTFIGRHFKVTSLLEQHQKFDGTMSDPYTWQITRRNPFVTVLIHNVPTDEIIIVEQFRLATMMMDGLPKGVPYKKSGMMLELVAGGLGKDTPEGCARREAKEEAKIELGELFEMSSAYPSPGGTDEYGFLFYAPVYVDTTIKEYIGGLPEENEDIFVRWIRFSTAISMCMSGEINDQKTQNGILFGEKLRRTLD